MKLLFIAHIRCMALVAASLVAYPHQPALAADAAWGGTLAFGVTKGQQTKPPANGEKAVLPILEPAKNAIQDKLDSILIPRIEFHDTPFEDAIRFLRAKAMELDVHEKDLGQKGVNIVMLDPDATAGLKIKSLSLKNATLGTALKYLCDQAKLQYIVDGAAVTIAAEGEADAKPALPIDEAARKIIQDKLNSIIIPMIELHDVTLDDTIEFLRVRAIQLDVKEPDPGKKGVNIVILDPNATAGLKVGEFSAKNVPLGSALGYICKQTKLNYTIDGTAVLLTPEKAGAE